MFVTRILIRRLSSASLSQAGNVIKESNKILVMAGAGLSVPSGIPDFRSPGSGIYDNLKQYNLPYPEAIFDINYFSHTPQPFYTWAKEFFPGVKYHPSIGHHFIKILDEKNKLLRMFTQNIDGLEAEAGLDHDKIVAAHGSFTSASCISCGQRADLSEVKNKILNDEIPYCGGCAGFIKPDIVFFGENLPFRFFDLQESDTAACDCLICIGTSLEVYPFAGLADMVPPGVNRILINRDAVGSFGRWDSDTILDGDLVNTVQELANVLGWNTDLERYDSAKK